jgi:phospholipase/carboxylesterase
MIENPDARLVQDGPGLALAGLVHRVEEPSMPGPHPTIVMLHGRSGDENVMWVFARTVPRDWLRVAPRAIKPDPEGGYTWHPRKRDEWPSRVMFDEAVAAVVKLVRALPELYHADPERLYLMGFSQGAATAYAAALQHPGLVRGIAGLVGFMPTGGEAVLSAAPLAGLPVFMAVGKRDPTIPLEMAEACARALRQAGARVEYRVYTTGHKLDAQGMRDLQRWWKERDNDEP